MIRIVGDSDGGRSKRKRKEAEFTQGKDLLICGGQA